MVFLNMVWIQAMESFFINWIKLKQVQIGILENILVANSANQNFVIQFESMHHNLMLGCFIVIDIIVTNAVWTFYPLFNHNLSMVHIIMRVEISNFEVSVTLLTKILPRFSHFFKFFLSDWSWKHLSFVINFLVTYISNIIRHRIFKKAPNCISCTEPVRQITLHFQDCLHENRQTRRKNRQKSVKTKRGCVSWRSKLSEFSKQKSADLNKDSSGPFFGRLWPSAGSAQKEFTK